MAKLATNASLTDAEIAEQAAMWTVELSADEPACKKALFAKFEKWQQLDSRHKKAAEQMQGFIHSVHKVAKKPKPVRSALSYVLASSHSSMLSSTIKGATLSLLLGFFVLVGVNRFPPMMLMADMSTSTGEWQDHILADGSQISLNSNSAIDVNFDGAKRELILITGEVKVNVSKDVQRPFIVSTEHGSVEALGTEFIVSHQDETTNLAMLESKTLVKTTEQLHAKVSQGLVVRAGFSVDISERELGDLTKISAKALTTAWQNKQLLVQDKPLAEVLDEINRHRSGHIFYDANQVKGLRVSAVLPLNDTEQALLLLMANYPQLKMRTLTSYAVFIGEK